MSPHIPKHVLLLFKEMLFVFEHVLYVSSFVVPRRSITVPPLASPTYDLEISRAHPAVTKYFRAGSKLQRKQKIQKVKQNLWKTSTAQYFLEASD